MLYDPKWEAPVIDKTSTILHRAADLIEQRGWCQNSLQDFKGRMCSIGAIQMAESNAKMTTQAAVKLSNYIQKMNIDRWGLVANWNDAKGRSKEEVVATIRAAADWKVG